MQNNDKKYFIPVDGTPIEVSEEIYRAYYQPIWNTRYHAQKNGECRCTKALVIERRVQYVLLITAFYFDYPHALEKQLKKYNNYIKTKRA